MALDKTEILPFNIISKKGDQGRRTFVRVSCGCGGHEEIATKNPFNFISILEEVEEAGWDARNEGGAYIFVCPQCNISERSKRKMETKTVKEQEGLLFAGKTLVKTGWSYRDSTSMIVAVFWLSNRFERIGTTRLRISVENPPGESFVRLRLTKKFGYLPWQRSRKDWTQYCVREDNTGLSFGKQNPKYKHTRPSAFPATEAEVFEIKDEAGGHKGYEIRLPLEAMAERGMVPGKRKEVGNKRGHVPGGKHKALREMERSRERAVASAEKPRAKAELPKVSLPITTSNTPELDNLKVCIQAYNDAVDQARRAGIEIDMMLDANNQLSGKILIEIDL